MGRQWPILPIIQRVVANAEARIDRSFLRGSRPKGELKVPAGTLSTPHFFPCTYLESAAFVTGETVHVDGRAHAGHW